MTAASSRERKNGWDRFVTINLVHFWENYKNTNAHVKMALDVSSIPTPNGSLFDFYGSTESNSNFTDNITVPVVTTMQPSSSIVEISTKISYVTYPIFAVLGLTILIIRSKYFRSSTTSVFLTALSLSDTTFILTSPFTKSFATDLFGQDPKAITEAGCKAFFCVFRSAKICSSWYVVIICIERFIVIWFPLHAKVISRRQTAVIAVSATAAAILIFDGSWTMTSGIVNGICVPSVTTPSTKDLSAAFLVAGTAIFNIIPTCVLLLFTPLCILQLHRQVSLRREISTVDRNEEASRITRMLLAIVVAYIFLVTPISVAHSIAFFNGDNIFTATNPDFVIFREIAQTFEQLNYSINFLLYVACNATFRRRFYVIVGCRRSATREVVARVQPKNLSTSTNQSSCMSTESSIVNREQSND